MQDRAVLRATVPGPWGPIHVAATDRGVVAVEWLTTDESFVAALERRLGITAIDAFATDDGALRGMHLASAVDALETMLAGRPPASGVEVDLADRPTWDRRVLDAVSAIGWGRTASYGEIARRIGAPRAARAVGGALGRNPIALLIPCHRIIASDGTIGGYGGDAWGSREERLAIKRELLVREGVTVDVRPQ